MTAERCMCGDPYCPSCGPAQGYTDPIDDTEPFDPRELFEEVIPPPRCDLVVRTGNDAWELGPVTIKENPK